MGAGNMLRTTSVVLLGALVAPGVGVGSAAAVGESATLHASFTPDRLGASTTISFSFEAHTEGGLAPPPLTGFDLRMPAGMNYIDTTLGLATCSRRILREQGAGGCPADSKLGTGSAFVELPFGSSSGRELPGITAWMGPSRNENMVVLFYVNGRTPVRGEFVFEGEVQPATGIFGSQLASAVPVVPGLTDGPDVSIVRATASIGPKGLHYYHKVHGKRRSFTPRGISVPERCPRGGFPFAAVFSFQDGSTATASTKVPCPKHKRRKR